MRSEEIHYRALFDAGAHGIVISSVGGKLLDANPEACRVLGRSREEIASSQSDEVLDRRDLRLAEAFRQLESTGKFVGDLRLLRRDGSPFTAEASLSRYHDGDDERIVLIFRDAAVRGEIEEAFRESEERYRTVVEQAAEGIFLVDASTGLIIESNAAFRRLIGFAPEELVGKTIHDIVANSRRSIEENIRRILEERSVLLGERNYRHKSGALLHVEVKVSAISHGGREVMCVIAQDITDRKHVEEALRKSRDRMRLVVESADLGTWELDPSTGALDCDARCKELFGLSPDAEPEYDSFLASLHPEDRERTHQTVQRTLQPEGGGDYEIEYRTVGLEDGAGRWVASRGQAFFDEAGRPTRFIGTALDITERKRAEEGVERSLNLLLALHEAGHVLGSTLEAEEIGTRLLKIMHSVSSLTAAVISVPDGRGGVRVWRSVGLEELWPKARYAPEAEAARRTAFEDDERGVFRLRRAGGEERLVGLCLPLRVRNRVIGLLEAYGPEGLAGEDAFGILSSLSTQAASALENARLYTELAEREKRLHELVGKLLLAQEEERRRVARDIHDGFTQLASAAYLNLQAFARDHARDDSPRAREDLDRIVEMIRQTAGESRRLIADLRPMVLDDLGLRDALRAHVEGLRRPGFEVGYEETLGSARLPETIETVLFRIAQEALTNVLKHAKTDRARVTLRRLKKGVRLRVRDWGDGFDPDAVHGEGPGERVGLSGMQERAKLLGAELEVYSRRGVGTMIVVDIALEEGGYARSGSRWTKAER